MSTEQQEREEYQRRSDVAVAALRRLSGDTERAYTLEEVNAEAARWTGVQDDLYGPLIAASGAADNRVAVGRGMQGRTTFSLTRGYVQKLWTVAKV